MGKLNNPNNVVVRTYNESDLNTSNSAAEASRDGQEGISVAKEYKDLAEEEELSGGAMLGGSNR